MNSDTLDQLAEAHDVAWRACHGKLAGQIAAARARLDGLETVRREHQAAANKAQKKFNEWARKAKRADPSIAGASMRAKYRARVEQRALYAKDAKDARLARDQVAQVMERLRAEVAAKDAELTYCKRHYYEVRSRYMEAIYEAEQDEPQALERKLEYMEAGKVPGDVAPEDVRHYLHKRPGGTVEVHLFYGGLEAPDGECHAHHVLLVAPTGLTKLHYQRAPK